MNAEICKHQAEAFLDFSSKKPGKKLYKLFGKWAGSKAFSPEDRRTIWRIVVKLNIEGK